MKAALCYLLFVLAVFIPHQIYAQGQFTISGTVSGEKGEVLKGVVVFISGSKKITATDNEGQFVFSNIDAGTFRLSVQMLGYAPYSQNIIIQEKSVNVNISLQVRSIVLNEVFIGQGNNWDAYFKTFNDQFLGITPNAKSCVILNPKIINFSTKKLFHDKILLKADADEFLIIENKNLGYRVKYLLKTFENNGISGITNYDGDTNFEEMEGTEEMKKEWAKNRMKAYKGSLMHFLRSIYSSTVLQEGFLTNQVYHDGYGKSYIDSRPVKFDTVVKVIDTSFISLKFTSLYVTYNPGNIVDQKTGNISSSIKELDANYNGTELKLYLNQAIVDRKGSYTDYRTFLIKGGRWAGSRVGDQLPFEYQPPDTAAGHNVSNSKLLTWPTN